MGITREMVSRAADKVFYNMAEVNRQDGMYEADKRRFAERLYQIRHWSIDQLKTERQMELMMEELQQIAEGIDLAVHYKALAEYKKNPITYRMDDVMKKLGIDGHADFN